MDGPASASSKSTREIAVARRSASDVWRADSSGSSSPISAVVDGGATRFLESGGCATSESAGSELSACDRPLLLEDVVRSGRPHRARTEANTIIPNAKAGA